MPQPIKTTKSARVRVPPIHITGVSTSAINNLLRGAGILSTEFRLKLAKATVQLRISTKEAFDCAVTMLKENAMEFFTHSTSDNIPVKFVLSGLPLFSINGLLAELKNAGFSPQEIKIMSKRKTDFEEYAVYLVYFQRGTVKLQDLRKKAAVLFNVVATWRFFSKRPTDAAQCHRCQRFGHGSANCYLNPQCVKCGNAHLTNECPLPKKGDLNEKNNSRAHVKCANCGGSHTANYRGCPSRKAYLESLEQRKKKQAKPPTRDSPPKLTPFEFPPCGGGATPTLPQSGTAGRGTYADVCKARGSGMGPPSGTDLPSDSLFTITEFLTLARDMFIRLNGCHNKQQQFMALSELLLTYIFDG